MSGTVVTDNDALGRIGHCLLVALLPCLVVRLQLRYIFTPGGSLGSKAEDNAYFVKKKCAGGLRPYRQVAGDQRTGIYLQAPAGRVLVEPVEVLLVRRYSGVKNIFVAGGIKLLDGGEPNADMFDYLGKAEADNIAHALFILFSRRFKVGKKRSKRVFENCLKAVEKCLPSRTGAKWFGRLWGGVWKRGEKFRGE